MVNGMSEELKQSGIQHSVKKPVTSNLGHSIGRMALDARKAGPWRCSSTSVTMTARTVSELGDQNDEVRALETDASALRYYTLRR